MRGDNSVCLAHEDGPKHIDSLLTTKFTAKNMCTLGFDEGDSEKLLLLSRICRGGRDNEGEFMEMSPIRFMFCALSGSRMQRKHKSGVKTKREIARSSASFFSQLIEGRPRELISHLARRGGVFDCSVHLYSTLHTFAALAPESSLMFVHITMAPSRISENNLRHAVQCTP